VRDMQAEMDLIWAHLRPAFRDSGWQPRAGADAELADRLTRLSTPRVDGAAAGPGQPVELMPTHTEGPFAGRVERVRIEPRPDGSRLTVTVRGVSHGFEVPRGTWADGVLPGLGTPFPEVAVSAGWVTGAEFRADVVSRRTPHRLELRARLGDAPGAAPSLSVGWHMPPLPI